MAVITGTLTDYPIAGNAPEFKGSVIIEWPAAAPVNAPPPPPVIPPQRVIPGCLTTVRDERDGEVIPCAGVTIHAPASGFVTADVAVFLDRQGAIIRDASVIWRESDGVPATFLFLVAEIRVTSGQGGDP